MFHNPERRSMRQTFAAAWAKLRRAEGVSDLERQIGAVIEWHPEYHRLIEDESSLERDFMPEDGQTNPFLHMSLHLAIRDQLATDRPTGIRDVFAQLRNALGDEHAAEHCLVERLGEALWKAQHDGKAPDEGAYLADLEDDLRRHGKA